MASVRERRRADGTRSFTVLWRDPETGRQASLTYDDEREAKVARELIGAAGGYATEAARIAEAVRRPSPTVLEAISEHIDLLTGVGADTSWMIAAGTDLFVLQRRLGHESIATTTETYAHLMPDQQRAAADAAGRVMAGLSVGLDDGLRGR